MLISSILLGTGGVMAHDTDEDIKETIGKSRSFILRLCDAWVTLIY